MNSSNTVARHVADIGYYHIYYQAIYFREKGTFDAILRYLQYFSWYTSTGLFHK